MYLASPQASNRSLRSARESKLTVFTNSVKYLQKGELETTTYIHPTYTD